METLDLSVLDNITQSSKLLGHNSLSKLTTYFLDEKINEKLGKLDIIEEKLEAINTRLESMNEHSGESCTATTGSFNNPAQNCSHVAQEHPNATSGMLLGVGTCIHCGNRCCIHILF